MGQGAPVNPIRRALLATPLALAACERTREAAYDGRWLGANAERGHRLRGPSVGEPAVTKRAGAIVVGAGIAGLAAARALMRGGVDDVRVLDLEDEAGGNARGHAIAGLACPLGAHYLPVPGEAAHEVAEWLEEIGLRRIENGHAVHDERHLCHSPQERLFIDGQWHDGLLPPVEALPAAQRAGTTAQYRRFATLVTDLGRDGAFAIPTTRSRWNPTLDALDATPFAAWLDTQRLDAPALRWYLDYCCRDDYGAGSDAVSAWAGLHYFASRHGFHPPGDGGEEREGVFTWPEGNAWLARRLARPLADRVFTGHVALRVREERHAAEVDLWNERERRIERWVAPQVLLAVPLFVASRLLESPPDSLAAAARAMNWSPWLVANLHLAEPLADRGGAPPSWDNVRYGSASLGYGDAMHQSTRPFAGPTVLTAYWAFGAATAEQTRTRRAELLASAWSASARPVVEDLAAAHRDLPGKVARIDLMRYGHAMAVPVPGVRSSAALRALGESAGRVQFAHADLSGYSVFEEAFFHGHRAGTRIAALLHA